jgi:phage tail sheath gpL-like
MPVSFNTIPSGIRVPLFYAEVDNSMANQAGATQRTLIIGQKLAAGTAVANTLQYVSSVDDARTLFGRGSQLARMVEKYRGIDPFCEIWCIAVADDAGGTQATGSIVFAGPATAAGTISLYIAGQKITAGVASGDTATTVAAAVAAAINAALDLPVTASASTGTVTITARHKGTMGNDIKLQMSYGGLAAQEKLPAGITAPITAMASGATDPSLTAAIAAMGDEVFDGIVHPWTDSTSLDAFKTVMNDTSGRWSYLSQIYGHVWSAKRDSVSNLATFGATRNDQHHTIAGVEAEQPNPVWEVAAAYAAKALAFLRIDPARPVQTGELLGILPAPAGQRFTISERQTLLSAGIATATYAGGAVRIERAITTYQKNANNQNDDSYLDVETLYTTAYVLNRLRTAITSKYARHKLANDGTRFGAGQAIVTPSVIRGEILSECYLMEEQGILENVKVMNAHMVVERNANNPNRLDVLFPPDYVNQLRIFALLNQFRLQYPASAA